MEAQAFIGLSTEQQAIRLNKKVTPESGSSALLLEDDSYLLLESGDKILLENG